MNAVAPASPEKSEGRLLEAPDRFRAQARSLATLAATGAGAIAAGLVFAPVSQSFPQIAIWFGYGAFVLLLIAVALYAYASAYIKAGPSTETTSDSAKRHGTSIRLYMRWASMLGLLALAGVAIMVVLRLAIPPDMTEVVVEPLDRSGAALGCTALERRFSAEVRTSDLSNPASQYVMVRVDPAACADLEIEWIEFDRQDVRIGVPSD